MDKEPQQCGAKCIEIIDQIPGAVIATDLEGYITHWSKGTEQLFGYSAKMTLKKQISFLNPNEEYPFLENHIIRPLKNKGYHEVQTYMRRQSGERIYINLALSLLRDSNGRAFGIIGYATDITEHKQIEKRLKEADQRKNEFLALLAHELRNPLVPIRNAVQLLTLQSDMMLPHIQQACALIDRQVSYLTRLADDLLDVAWITRGQLILQKKPCNIVSCIEQAVEVIRPMLAEKGHDLILKLPSAPLLIEADPARLIQIIENLLDNAVKYTHKGGRIALTVAIQGQQAMLTIADNGIGIPAELLPHIFDCSSYIGHPLKHSYHEGGLGLGLDLTKSLVEMHGGQISAASPGSSQGSTFTVQLPVINVSSQLAATPAIEDSSTATPYRRVLIVDDNRDIAYSFEILIELWGHKVQIAFDGPTALEIIHTFQPEIVLLDIGLPGMDGYEVARCLRTKYGQHIKLIALTGYGQEKDKEHAKEAGFNHHLTKPPQLEALKDLLASISVQ
jgi:PAS domain S-box-containing protein